jgi:hypothetical protein
MTDNSSHPHPASPPLVGNDPGDIPAFLRREVGEDKGASLLALNNERMLGEHADEIRRLGKRVVSDIIEIGERFTECKRLTGHGYWAAWLHQQLGWGEDTALNFMRVFEMSKSRNFRDLNIGVSTLYLLARPSTPESAREEILNRAQAGKPIKVGEVESIINQHKSEARDPCRDKPPTDMTLPYAQVRRETKPEGRYDQLKRTSLGSKREMDALITLKDRWPQKGENLIQRALAGETVSAIAAIDDKARQPSPTIADLHEAWKKSFPMHSVWQRADAQTCRAFCEALLSRKTDAPPANNPPSADNAPGTHQQTSNDEATSQEQTEGNASQIDVESPANHPGRVEEVPKSQIERAHNAGSERHHIACKKFGPLREILASVRRTGCDPVVDTKSLKIKWTDQAGKRHTIDAPVTPEERETLMQSTKLLRQVAKDPRAAVSGFW